VKEIFVGLTLIECGDEHEINEQIEEVIIITAKTNFVIHHTPSARALYLTLTDINVLS
jgi:hypothetical protein